MFDSDSFDTDAYDENSFWFSGIVYPVVAAVRRFYVAARRAVRLQ
jgi:uncharacterized protein (UPF0548 family)